MKIPVVVVDDDEVDRYLVNRVLKSMDIDAKLVEFDDGVPFVDVIRDNEQRAEAIGEPPPPILVLLDINMPRMGGFEVLEAMREALSEEEQVMFVTMYSSSNYAQDRADAEKYPFVKDYIVKPVTREKLEEIVERLYPRE